MQVRWERFMSKSNRALHNAKILKNDEFYTQLSDIEKELKHYKDHLKGTVVFCNCDDPDWSNFWKYFHLYFEFLGLKKLITTHYDASEPTYKMEYEGGNDADISVGTITPLKQNGDFRSPECIELLKQADIVITNPPFSLFREYVGQLFEYEKKFIIIGNINCITYKEIFPLLKANKMWIGVSIHSGDRQFYVPDDYPLKASNCGVDETGRKFIRVKGVRWFTNLDNKNRHEPIDLVEHYTPEKYPNYDNYDAIEVSRVLDIPVDYDGTMGVPISFMDKYCPEQFEIIGIAKRGAGDPALKSKVYTKEDYENYSDLNAGPVLIDENGKLYNTYPRILIKRKG